MAVDLLCPTFPFTSYDSPGCRRELVARLEAVEGIETIAEAFIVPHRWNIGPNKEPLGSTKEDSELELCNNLGTNVQKCAWLEALSRSVLLSLSVNCNRIAVQKGQISRPQMQSVNLKPTEISYHIKHIKFLVEEKASRHYTVYFLRWFVTVVICNF